MLGIRNINRARSYASVLTALLVIGGATGAQAQRARNVIINAERLSADVLQVLEAHYRIRVADGRYWYDSMSGAWGIEGGPTVGLILPGLRIGGPLAPDASNGTTLVWINGRRLPARDLVALQQLTGPIAPGRYWVDGDGWGGYEGGPPIVNLRDLAARSSRSAWSHYTRSTDASVGGDGDFFYYIDRNTSVTGGR